MNDQSVVNGDQSVVNVDQSALNEVDDPDQQLLPNAAPEENGSPGPDQGIEMQSLEGSIQNQEEATPDLHKAASEIDHPQGDSELD